MAAEMSEHEEVKEKVCDEVHDEGAGEALAKGEAHAETPDVQYAKLESAQEAAGGLPTVPGEALAPLWFPELPSKPARLLPPLALAYIGDAVFEVAVRQHVIARPNLRPHHLHIQATKFVSAKAQARMLALIEPQLTEQEQDVVRQGRNAKSGTVPKNANVLDYRHATAFESLIGYLYYTGAHDRLRGLILQGFELLEQE